MLVTFISINSSSILWVVIIEIIVLKLCWRAPIDKPSSDDKAISYPIQIAPQMVLKPHSEPCILETTGASSINIIEPGYCKEILK